MTVDRLIEMLSEHRVNSPSFGKMNVFIPCAVCPNKLVPVQGFKAEPDDTLTLTTGDF